MHGPRANPAPYASHPEASRGRLHDEAESPTRSPFQRDRDRIIHSTAFRRLMHKTQVFVAHEGDHYRTRLTHSLEVAQIARSISRALGLDEDLAEALALAHDFGHTPFGHAGEEALAQAMAAYGGFDHNAQTVRILTRLERRYADFDGLNLTRETLEGLAKHNGPLDRAALPRAIAEYDAEDDLELDTYPGAEAQVAALADDIAYNNHDIDDGLRAGLFAPDDLADLPLVGPVFAGVAKDHPGIEQPRLVHESVRRLIDRMVTDLIDETGRRLAQAKPDSVAAIRALGRPVVAFSAEMEENDRALKDFLHKRMYRHEMINRMTERARRLTGEIFARFMAEPATLPPEWRTRAGQGGERERACVVADYVAGMTDPFAMAEHERLFPGGAGAS
ncbi:MAG: deoxyguanosinetriphosphate triphosphohydrolase [Alphaproteobacteria bacterium]